MSTQSQINHRNKHRDAVLLARRSIAKIIPNGGFHDSVCSFCSEILNCRAALKTGALLPCQPQDQDTACFVPARFSGDFDQLLADHAPTGYHQPRKREIITGA